MSDESDKQHRSLLDWLSWAMGSIGDIAEAAILLFFVAVGGYFLMQVGPVQDFIRSILPADWQAGLSKMLGDVGIEFPFDVNTIDPKALPDDLKGQGYSDDMANALGQSWNVLKQEAITAHDGKSVMTLKELFDDKTLYRLLDRQAPLVLRLVQIAQKGKSSGTDLAPMLASVAAIAKDDVRLSTLLDAGHRKGTGDVLEALCPIKLKTPGALMDFVTTVGMDGGRATQPLKDFLTTTIGAFADQGGDAVRKAFVTFIATSKQLGQNPKALALLAAQIDTSRMAGGEKQLYSLLANEKNAALTVDLFQRLGAEKSQIALDTLTQPDKLKAIQQLEKDHPEIAKEIGDWIGKLDKKGLPADLQAAVTLAANPRVRGDIEYMQQNGIDVGSLAASFAPDSQSGKLDPAQAVHGAFGFLLFGPRDANGHNIQRTQLMQHNNIAAAGDLINYYAGQVSGPQKAELAFLATTAPMDAQHVRYVNLAAITECADKIGTNPANAQNPKVRTILESVGMMGATGNPGYLTYVMSKYPQEFTAFFGNMNNRIAVGDMLKTFSANSGKLDPASAEMLTTFSKHWGSLSEVLARPQDAAVLTTFLQAMTTRNMDLLKTLSPQAVADYFAVPANAAAIGDLLHVAHKHIGSLAPSYARVMDVLDQYYDDGKGHGFRELLSDPDSAQLVLQSSSTLDAIGSALIHGEFSAGHTLYENQDYITQLKAAKDALKQPASNPSIKLPVVHVTQPGAPTSIPARLSSTEGVVSVAPSPH